MQRLPRRIVCISIPHIFVESEESKSHRHLDLPLVVVSGNLSKGVILDYSETLAAFRVKKGMFLRSITPLRGKIRVLPADYEHVEELSRKVIHHLKNYSPYVESLKAGEYYLDLTGTRRLFGRELDTCGKLVHELKTAYGFTSRIGIGRTTLTARMASQVAGGCGVYDVCEASENLFLSPLSVELIAEISPLVRKELLWNYNIQRIGDLRLFTRHDLACMFGREGEVLYNYSRGLSRNRLVDQGTEKVLKKELIVSSESNDDGILRRSFFSMILELCTRMRREYIFPQAFRITVVYQDNYRYVYSGRLKRPSFFEKRLYGELITYLNRALLRRTCMKKIVLSFSHFVPPSLQPALFHNDSRMEKLAGAFDVIQKKLGKKYIRYGV
jgi:DNA polymerase-4